MNCQVLLFAAARDLANSERLDLDVPPPVTAAAVLDGIGRQVPSLLPLLPACRLAVDQAFVPADFPVSAGSELALIPPVSGG